MPEVMTEFEENLAGEVQKYRLLYDTQHPDHSKEDAVHTDGVGSDYTDSGTGAVSNII